MKILKNTKKLITALLVSVAIFLSGQIFLSAFSLRAAKAETSIDITTSSVRDDLESMDMDKLSYLSDTKNIFITMSQYYDTNNQLRSYIYINFFDRTSDYKLYVNLSVAVSDSNYNITEEYKDYELTFINNEETWCKYEIIGLSNLFEVTRRYNIKSVGYYVSSTEESIYVPIISNIEQTFIYHGITNDSLEVFHQEIETITITDKQIAFYCYGDGMGGFLFPESTTMNEGDIYTDSWYIFFNTDKKIDELLEIEITYTQYDYSLYNAPYNWARMDFAVTENILYDMKKGEFGLIYSSHFESKKSTFDYCSSSIVKIEPGTTKVPYVDKGWFGTYSTTYEELDNIMDLRKYHEEAGDSFVFTSYAEKYTWGVHFHDTTRKIESYGGGASLPICGNYKGSGMSDVAILRLRFMTDRIVKNCYAVDTPTSDFEGNSAQIPNYGSELKMIIALVFLLVIAVALGPSLAPVITFLFNFLGKLFRLLFKFLWSIITFPFKLFRRSSTKKRKR